jgi:CDP-diacylglycerol--glycerol-3-phosphate 3-phosphatidyltransferase
MERAERIIALCVGLAFSTFMMPILWLMLVLTAATAIQRFFSVWRQASAPRPVRMSSTVASRWRTWREVTGSRHDRERWRVRRSRRAGTRP